MRRERTEVRVIGNCELYCGDCLDILPTLGADLIRVDAIVTDPPYASGGLSAAQRIKSTKSKYTNEEGAALKLPEFAGDSIDQRLWQRFMAGFLKAAKPLLKPTAPYMLFIDWRQLPALMDCMMLNDYLILGVAVWNKVLTRPNPDAFAQSAEFICWGRMGKPRKSDKSYYGGCIFDVRNEMNNAKSVRYHVTQKPVVLMKQLFGIVQQGGLVLDPFMGSGTTGIACVETGRRFIGIEKSPEYFEIAYKRIKEAVANRELFGADERQPAMNTSGGELYDLETE